VEKSESSLSPYSSSSSSSSLRGELILLPNLIHEDASIDCYLPPKLKDVIASLTGLICESEKEGRFFLRRFLDRERAFSLPKYLLNEHTEKKALDDLISLLKKQGAKIGLISDAGLPCIADPGSELVYLARKENISVSTYSGPSSILMAIQLSGFPSQSFCFHGYLPREDNELANKLKKIEKTSLLEKSTQVWIEAPYRTDKMVDFILSTLQGDTELCVASNLTGKEERVEVKNISSWKKEKKPFGKKPAIFLINAFFRR
jgi:16S rRNA (cytidine1402-2'-O)-methyltransferase